MERACPQCGSTRTYVQDVNGRIIEGDLILYMVQYCTGCKHEWQTEQEAYVNQERTL